MMYRLDKFLRLATLRKNLVLIGVTLVASVVIVMPCALLGGEVAGMTASLVSAPFILLLSAYIVVEPKPAG